MTDFDDDLTLPDVWMCCGCGATFESAHRHHVDGQVVLCPSCVALRYGPAAGRIAAADAPDLPVPADLLLRLVDATRAFVGELGVDRCEELEDAGYAIRLAALTGGEWVALYSESVRPYGPTSARAIAHQRSEEIPDE